MLRLLVVSALLVTLACTATGCGGKSSASSEALKAEQANLKHEAKFRQRAEATCAWTERKMAALKPSDVGSALAVGYIGRGNLALIHPPANLAKEFSNFLRILHRRDDVRGRAMIDSAEGKRSRSVVLFKDYDVKARKAARQLGLEPKCPFR